MSEIEGNQGKISYPGGAIRPQIQATTAFNSTQTSNLLANTKS